MAGTIFSNNTTIKISGGGTSTTSAAGTIFTTASNEYAIVTISAGTISVGGATFTGATTATNLYVGPSKTVIWNVGTIAVSWVIFTNTP